MNQQKYKGGALSVARKVGAFLSQKCALSVGDLPGALRLKFEEFSQMDNAKSSPEEKSLQLNLHLYCQLLFVSCPESFVSSQMFCGQSVSSCLAQEGHSKRRWGQEEAKGRRERYQTSKVNKGEA